MKFALCLLLPMVGLTLHSTASAASSAWPGETWEAAIDLTSLNPVAWSKNLSGAYWNPVTRRLWLADNAGTFSVIKEDGAGGFVKEADFFPGGDLEGITQADP